MGQSHLLHMLERQRTEIVFSLCSLLGLLSVIVLIGFLMDSFLFVIPIHGLIIWALVKSETEGFFKSKDMPRAGDPPREFHPLQSFVLFLIVIAQVALSAYFVLTA